MTRQTEAVDLIRWKNGVRYTEYRFGQVAAGIENRPRVELITVAPSTATEEERQKTHDYLKEVLDETIRLQKEIVVTNQPTYLLQVTTPLGWSAERKDKYHALLHALVRGVYESLNRMEDKNGT